MNSKLRRPERLTLACTSLTLVVFNLAPGYAQAPDPFNPGANAAVYTTALQADGRVLLGGAFTNLAGQSCSRLGRVNLDGTLDPTFNPGPNGEVYCLAVQADGKILAGGAFTSLGGLTRNRLGRLNADGSVDPTFSAGASNTVYALALQPDGRILVAGTFTGLGGTTRNRVGRLSADGTLDSSFDPGANGDVYSLAVQADGSILAGGGFTSLGGLTRNYLGRVDGAGAPDTAFGPNASNKVYCLAVQPNGKILVGGAFTNLAAQTCKRVARLNSNGTLDTGFGLGASGDVYTLALQADGRILVGGNFTNLAGLPRGYLGRLNADGSPDTSFNPGAGTNVFSLALQTDGKILVGGGFTNLGGVPRSCIGRLTNAEPATQSLTFDRSIITWLRGGTSAEVWRSSFDTSTNGLDWVSLGAGTNIAGGWQLTGVSLPTNATLRARGFTTGGRYNGSCGLAETMIGPPGISVQPISQLAAAGQTVGFNVTAGGSPCLGYRWRKGGTNLVGGTGTTLLLTNVQLPDIGRYDVVVTNSLGAVTSVVAKLTMTVVDGLSPGPMSASAYAVAVQADERILVGGYFGTLGGQPRHYLGRLNADGTLDSAFADPAANGHVFALAVHSDGKVVAGGWFTSLAGQTRTFIGRLNPDGTLDTAYKPEATKGINSPGVYGLALQADGKLLVGGDFRSLGGRPCTNIGRLNMDGTLDTAFRGWANDTVYPVALQPDGKILVGGAFTTLCGQSRSNIGRLNADGTLDAAFNGGIGSTPVTLTVQTDGKILVGGGFTVLNGQIRNRIGRLHPDGTLDTSFDPGANDVVRCLVAQADGKILAGGQFTMLGGLLRSRIGRLNPDGTLDTTFDPGANANVCGLTVQAEGKVLVVGDFSSLGGQTRYGIGRLSNTDPATQSLGFDASKVTWLRGEASPEVWRTTFETCTNGNEWLDLGPGERIPGGWQLTGVSVPADASLRARGFVASGRYNGSAWFTEVGIGAPSISVQPSSRTNDACTTAGFSVVAGGAPPWSYQWCKDDARLSDVGSVSGAQSPTLLLANVLRADEGGYSVIVSNASGCVTSLVAALSVRDPVMLSQHISQTATQGQTVVFTATACGTEPLSYGWAKSGLAVAGATGASLTLTNVQWADGGLYVVLATNAYGSFASAEAELAFPSTADSFNPPVDGPVYTLAVQTDGKILAGGEFSTVGAQPHRRIVRLNPDGSPDSTFKARAGSAVYSLATPVDGRILVGGAFTTLGDSGPSMWTRKYLGRFNPDGTVDLTFDPGADNAVFSLVVQADGKVLVGGAFTTLAGQTRNRLGRINSDGSLDMTFDPRASATVYCLALQPDGKILVGGSFTNLAGQARSYIGRLNADGSLDESFDMPANGTLNCFAVQPDGKILVGGTFRLLGGQARDRLARLNEDGSLDYSFNPGPNQAVNALAVQANGKILVGGAFTWLGGQTHNCIGRLNADGSADAAFTPGANATLYSIAVQADGGILAGGSFNWLGGPHSYIGRLVNTYPATENLAFAGSTITWLRGGASPEVWRTTFDASTNGNDWVSLCAGTRVPGGWQLAGVPLPANSTIRARGPVTAGHVYSSDWFVESSAGPPAISRQPSGRTNDAATLVVFSVLAAGTPPMSYQWRKGGAALDDRGGALEVHSSTLTFTNVHWADAGSYDVVVSNSFGSVTSAMAFLAVRGPIILVGDGNLGFLSNRFGFSVGSMPGQAVLVEASTNLLNWIALQTSTVTATGLFTFSDPAPGDFPCRFYRVRLQ